MSNSKLSANALSDTPRTDAAVVAMDHVRGAPVQYVTADFVRQLERELAEVKKQARIFERGHIAAEREIDALSAVSHERAHVEDAGSPCPHERAHELDGRCAGCDCGKPSHADCCRFVMCMLRSMGYSPLADRVAELINENAARANPPTERKSRPDYGGSHAGMHKEIRIPNESPSTPTIEAAKNALTTALSLPDWPLVDDLIEAVRASPSAMERKS